MQHAHMAHSTCKCRSSKMFFSSLLLVLSFHHLTIQDYRIWEMDWRYYFIILIRVSWRFLPSFTWRYANEFNMHSMVKAQQMNNFPWTWNFDNNERVQPIWQNNMYFGSFDLLNSMKCSKNFSIVHLFEWQMVFIS